MRVILFCILIAYTQCSKRVTENNTVSAPDWAALNETIEAEIGSNTQTLNDTKSVVLAVHEKAPTEITNRYLVIDIATATILKKGSFRPGYIKWRNNNSLELLNVPGMIPEGRNLSDYIEIIQLPITQ